MELLEHFRRQFAYDSWANAQVIAVLKAVPNGSQLAKPVELLGHILAAERVWLDRLRQVPQSVAVWPEIDLAHCESQIGEIKALWEEYLAELSDSKLSSAISYKNTKGEHFTSVVQDVLNHIVMHSAYHRGQIASLMRTAGLTPAYTDFIHAVRQGFIK